MQPTNGEKHATQKQKQAATQTKYYDYPLAALVDLEMVKVKGLEMSISASTIVLEPTQLARLGYQSYQEKEMEAHVDLASLKAQFQNFSTSTGIKLSKQWASIDQPFDLVETAKVLSSTAKK